MSEATQARDERSRVVEMIRNGDKTAAISRAVGVSCIGVRRIRRTMSPTAPFPVGELTSPERAALKRLNRAFDRFEWCQTRATYDAWQDALREYDQVRKVSA